MNRIGLLFVLLSWQVSAQTLVKDLSCEHLTNPIGIDAQKPRLSWKLTASQRNTLQIAYQIRVATSAQFDKKSVVWDSGKINSGESILQTYAGPALQATKRYYWQVKVWDNKGTESAWSEAAFWEMGISNWTAQWIDPEQEINTKTTPPSPLLRKEFTLKKKVQSARLYVSSRGLNTMYINGQRVSDYYFTPGWTAYQDHYQYFTFDVANLLKAGPNAIGAMMGDGWYRGFLAWENNRNSWGERLALLAQLVVTYSDGSQQVIGTDATWKATNTGPIRMSDIYQGETYDARLEKSGWANANFNDSDWWQVKVANYPFNNLVSPQGQPVRRIEEIKALKVFKTPAGDQVIDFGQEVTGWVRMTVRGAAGTTVTIQHAEVLDKKGNFYNANLRAAKCELNYTLKGIGEEVYEPNFTFQGFRYIRVKGFPTELTVNNFTAVVVHTDMPKTGEFTCSNALLNQLQHNIQWGQKGNFLDVPTDCPQRDERLGWTGDAQAFSRTAAYNYNVAGFFSKWLNDLIADQAEDGTIPFVIPDVLQKSNLKHKQPSAGWADVATIAPWNMYLIYGDKQLLARQYPSMVKWVEYMNKNAKNYLYSGSVFGDWLFYQPRMEGHTEKNGYTDLDYLSTAFFAFSTDILRQTAQVLGKKEDEAKYAALFANIKEAFNREYVAASGRTISDSQTSYVLGLMFNLFKDEYKNAAAAQLVKDIKSRNNHLSTGFLGTPYLCHVLSATGNTKVAYDLLFQETYPSWLYPVKMGATTIWERWDGIRTDTTFQDVGMNSFNHYAYGAIGDWMYRTVAGIEIGKAGYKHILIQPQPTDKLSFAKANFNSSYGEIASGWERSSSGMILSVKIPANTTATIKIPTQNASSVRESGNPVTNAKTTASGVEVEVGSGDYVFEFN
ncbi:MAG: glycoside hydrolase family 78 protein [Spirosomataceae bacterium]